MAEQRLAIVCAVYDAVARVEYLLANGTAALIVGMGRAEIGPGHDEAPISERGNSRVLLQAVCRGIDHEFGVHAAAKRIKDLTPHFSAALVDSDEATVGEGGETGRGR